VVLPMTRGPWEMLSPLRGMGNVRLRAYDHSTEPMRPPGLYADNRFALTGGRVRLLWLGVYGGVLGVPSSAARLRTTLRVCHCLLAKRTAAGSDTGCSMEGRDARLMQAKQ